MAFQKISFRAGINLQKTQLLNEGGWSSANCIRFREGMPEVLGGWTALGTTALTGVPRGTHAWSTLAGVPTIAVGTSQYLYVIQFTTAYEITPATNTTHPVNPFTVTSGSAVVTVNDPGAQAPLQVGTVVVISGATAVEGVQLNGTRAIESVTGSTSYTVNGSGPAISGATGGGTPILQYLLPAGAASATSLLGWGIGTWGAGTWGTPRAGGFATQQPRIWTLDNFGQDLIACPRGVGIFLWTPNAGTSARATPIPQAPAQANAIFVSNAAEQVIALGGVPADGGAGAAADPMLVSWCNSGDYGTWIAGATNNAGNFPLTNGSQLMWGGAAAQQNLIWSDTALYSMLFEGGQLIYGFLLLGTNCGLIGPQAACIINGVAFWMSRLNFMSYSGAVGVVDCPVRDFVFKNLDVAQAFKITCSPNSQFNEVRWDFPSVSGGTGENDSFVIFNFVENTWTTGSNAASEPSVVARTAWSDVSAFGNPTAFDASGNAWVHENENVYTAGTLTMPWSLTSGFVDIAAGEQMMFVDWMLPDQILTTTSGGTPSISATLSFSRYTGDVPGTLGPFVITPTTESVYPRCRGRQIAVTFANNSGGNLFWRLGAVRIRAAPDGRN